MRNEQLAKINDLSFTVSLCAIAAGVAIGLLGIWRFIPSEDWMLWRLLGTCAAIFAGSVGASLAIRCFKMNA